MSKCSPTQEQTYQLLVSAYYHCLMNTRITSYHLNSCHVQLMDKEMHAIGKMHVCFQLAGKEDVFIFIYLCDVKALQLLSSHYPLPPPVPAPSELRTQTTIALGPIPTLDDLKEYPTVFDGNIRTMDGEEFHISPTTETKPFCVNTPKSILFAYQDKLKTE